MPTYLEYMNAARNAANAGDEEDARELYRMAKLSQTAPEMPSGTPEQMAQIRARNIQLAEGLDKPVMPPSEQSAPMFDRLKASFASTQEARRDYYNILYGEGNWFPISEGRNLVPAGSPENPNVKDRFVIDNPVGLDAGDVVELAGKTPELIPWAVSLTSKYPTGVGTIAKLAQVSGASAAAAQTAGAIQDVLFRFATHGDLPDAKKAEEIATRRLGEGAVEFVAGMAFPMIGGNIASKVKSARDVRKYYTGIKKEGKEAVETIREFTGGISNSAEIGQAIRETSLGPGAKDARAVGDYIAKIVSDADAGVRQKVGRELGRASGMLDQQALMALDAAAPRVNLPPNKIVDATIVGAGDSAKMAKQQAQALFDSALQEIDLAAKDTGAGKYFVSLNNTKQTIKELKSTPLRGAPSQGRGDVVSLFPLKVEQQTGEFSRIDTTPIIQGIVADLEKAVGQTQQLQAVRNARSRLGEFIGGKSDLFPGLDVGAAKKLYAALSQDMKGSIAKVSGKAGENLRAAEAVYADLIELTETNPFARKLVNNEFNNPSDLVDTLMTGGKTDWDVAQRLIPKPVFDQVRRVVIDTMKGDSTVKMMGQDVMDVQRLLGRMNAMKDPTIRDQLFGGRNGVEVIRRVGERQEALQRVGGIFTRPSLPTMDEMDEAINIAQQAGLDKANQYFDNAVQLAKSRRNGLAESLLSLSRNGNYTFAARNPEEVLDAVIFNNEMRPQYVQKFIAGMPQKERTDLGNMAFQRIFENARNATESAVKGSRQQYDVDKIVNSVFGSKDRMDAMTDLIGDKRMDVLRAWVAYDTKLTIDKAKKGAIMRQASNLAATLPYPNLFAARATSMALDSIAGMKFLQGANPANITAFPQARSAMLLPTKSARDIAIIQQAINEGGKEMFNNYNELMDGLTPERAAAVNQYLFGIGGN